MPLWPWFGSNRAWGKIKPEVPSELEEKRQMEQEIKRLEEENKQLRQEIFDLDIEEKVSKVILKILEERDERR